MKIGIVGLGFMGASHLRGYSKIPGVEVAAVCSQDERKLNGDLSQVGGNIKQPGDSYDFSRMQKFTEWRELIVAPGLDAVDICLPTDLHAAVTIAALTAGKHVLCEKPMALTSADCDRMIATAEAQNRILMIGQVLRFWPDYEYLRNLVEEKKYGAAVTAKFTRSCGLPDWSRWLPVEARSGGAALDLLIHDIDQVLLLFGLPEYLSAKPVGDVDALTATLTYPNRLEVQIEGGWLLPGAPLSMSFELVSERAQLEMSGDGLTLAIDGGAKQKITLPAADAYDAEIAYFIDCCQNGRKPDRCLPQESARAVKVALLLKQARAAGGEKIKCSV